MTELAIPFTIPGIPWAAVGIDPFAEDARVASEHGRAEGILRTEGADLVLEYRVVDPDLGGLGATTGVQRVRLTPAEVREVTLRRGWWRPELRIALLCLPASESGLPAPGRELRLRLPRRVRAEAEELVTTLALEATRRLLGGAGDAPPRLP